ncbi:MAG TPA: epoxide hydrolase [Bryobacteraceae bacterium]|jgi:microsomal epoxide hydrolase|nr:epoxide hydrolase [Bryobacteraceae bacterium]
MAQAQQPQKARPFRVEVPQATIKRIITRVREARLPDRIDAPDWSYGVNWDYMRALAEYWATKFDWRKAEASLNRYPQFVARVEDYDIHFYHVRGRGPNPMPLILTHGWPGSVFEFLEGIGPLSATFDVVVPSLPGFGFSSKPKGKPVGPVTTARLWHRLMTEVLGYRKFGAQGGDWGMRVTMELAAQFPESVIGIHLNAAAAGAPIPDAEQTAEEREWIRAVTAARTAELDYFNEQQHKPQTVAFALYDNPIGAAAWIAEKMKGWSDAGFTEDQTLTNVMIYLVTDTVGTGVWFYRGAGDERSQLRGKLMTPTGFAAFPKEMPYLAPPRSIIERGFNLVHYTKMPHGGHFACLEQPELLTADIREFFGKLQG